MQSLFRLHVVVLLHVFFAALPIKAQPTSTANPGALFNRYGMRTLASPSPASDFSLPDLQGKKHSLQDYRGQWVLLNFWATWCSACASQIQDLNALHTSQGNNGLKILAVAVEGSPEQLQQYRQQKDMRFTILRDKVGTIAATYKASSIPLNYIIDPMGRVVAIVRGAFNWQKTIPLFATLNGEPYEPTTFSPSTHAQNPDQNLFDPDLEPPKIRIDETSDSVLTEIPFDIKILVEWSGNLNDYILEPPKLALPDGIQKVSMQAIASSTQGRQALTYNLTLAAAQPGNYQLGPIDLYYRPRLEQNPLSTRIEGPEIVVKAKLLLGMPTKYALLILAALLTLCCIIYARYRLHLKHRAQATDFEESQENLLGQLFENAKRARLEGQSDIFLENALQFLEHSKDLKSLSYSVTEIQNFLEKARFANELPSLDILEAMERQMQRYLKQSASKSAD